MKNGLGLKSFFFFKTNRFYTAFVYAIIAYNVFDLAKSTFFGNSLKDIVKVNDPTRLVHLLFRVAEMFMVNKTIYIYKFWTNN